MRAAGTQYRRTFRAAVLALGFTGGSVAIPFDASAVPPAPLIIASQGAPVRAHPSRLPDAPMPSAAIVVGGPAMGQAGYVHYFIITGPDGEPESHVGIELPDQRIAWSFPELGVSLTPFIRNGIVNAGGKSYDVEYLYGLRPFRDDQRMRNLQTVLMKRISWFLKEPTPYCSEEVNSQGLCVSCLGFVMRVLFPGSSPAMPAVPADFRSARKSVYTTEDLLLYLAGVRIDEPREARLKRIAALQVPDSMREELTRIAENENDFDVAAAGQTPAVAPTKRRIAGRPSAPTRKPAARRRS